METDDLIVQSVQKIPRQTTGKFIYVVTIAFECLQVENIRASATAPTELNINVSPLQLIAPFVPMENKFMLILDEEEWKTCSKSFIVGEKVSLDISEKSIALTGV